MGSNGLIELFLAAFKSSEEEVNSTELITEHKNGMFRCYFKKSVERVGVGKTELEALTNLKELIHKKIVKKNNRHV